MSLLLKRTTVFRAAFRPSATVCLLFSEQGRHNGLIKVRLSVHIHHVVLKTGPSRKTRRSKVQMNHLFMDQCCVQGPCEKKIVFFFLGGFVFI